MQRDFAVAENLQIRWNSVILSVFHEEIGHPDPASRLLCRLDALPGRRELDENAFLAYSESLVQRDQSPRLINAGLLVEGQSGVHFRGDSSGNYIQDLFAEQDARDVECRFDLLGQGARASFVFGLSDCSDHENFKER